MTPGSGSSLGYGFDASANLTTLPGGAAATYNNGSELTSAALAGTTKQQRRHSNQGTVSCPVINSALAGTDSRA
jgi:hypothetical protein